MKVFAKSAEKQEREGGWVLVVSCWRAGGREGQSWVRSLRGPCSVRGPQSTPGRGSPERRTNNRGKVYTADRRARPRSSDHSRSHGTRHAAARPWVRARRRAPPSDAVCFTHPILHTAAPPIIHHNCTMSTKGKAERPSRFRQVQQTGARKTRRRQQKAVWCAVEEWSKRAPRERVGAHHGGIMLRRRRRRW